jgi:hypothetical protein
MSPALTAPTWMKLMEKVQRMSPPNSAVIWLAEMLWHIANESDDPIVAEIFDHYGLIMLEGVS